MSPEAKHILKQLPELRAYFDALKAEAADVSRVIDLRVEQILWEKFRVKPGVLVSYRGKTYMVAGVETRWGEKEKPWIAGRLEKKDGTFSTRAKRLYADWEVI